MKDHQYQEITAALSIIIALLCYKFEVPFVFEFYVVKSVFDTYCAITSAKKAAKKEKK